MGDMGDNGQSGKAVVKIEAYTALSDLNQLR